MKNINSTRRQTTWKPICRSLWRLLHEGGSPVHWRLSATMMDHCTAMQDTITLIGMIDAQSTGISEIEVSHFYGKWEKARYVYFCFMFQEQVCFESRSQQRWNFIISTLTLHAHPKINTCWLLTAKHNIKCQVFLVHANKFGTSIIQDDMKYTMNLCWS